MTTKIRTHEQNAQRKQAIFAIALTLLLTVSSFMTATPMANAKNIETFAFLTVAPSPVGLNQQVTIVMWLSMPPPTASGYVGDHWIFNVDVTKPDGSTQKLGPFESEAVGSSWTIYTPDQTGTYYFQMTFAGQRVNGTNAYGFAQVDNYYEPSKSSTTSLTVQTEQIRMKTETPTPTGYWSRPINAENREWYTIAGNWLQTSYNASFAPLYGTGGGFNPYTTAPDTAHIAWTTEFDLGGIVGGDYGAASYYTGQSYENKFSTRVIMNGRLYYNTRLGSSDWSGVTCVDLRTGEELWWKSGTIISMGQILNYDSMNQHGAIPYLWSTSGSTWKMYDAATGTWILDIEGVPTERAISKSILLGEDGSIIIYLLSGANNWMAKWNSTTAISPTTTLAWTVGEWRPTTGGKYNWTTGIEWNVTVPDVPGSQSIAKVGSGIALAYSVLDTTPVTVVHVGYNLTNGAQIWVQNRTNQYDYSIVSTGVTIWGMLLNGVYTEWVKEKMQWYGYSAYTGEQLWVSEPYNTSDWGMYQTTIGAATSMAYGKFYATGYDGCIHCYNTTTGKELWTFYAGSSGFETVYGTWPFWGSIVIADGKVYASTGEHSPSSPLPTGEALYCVNAETGEGIWNITGLYENMAVADGYMVTFNGYDNRIYCFGKGQTATTVTASPKVTTQGSTVLIEGTVTDQSQGAQSTPAISDSDMTAWMEYLYMQQTKPADATGVIVHLTATDPNDNTQDIGTATSNALGNYAFEWTPPVPGLYTVTATFEGSDSYYRSEAGTAFIVSEATATTPATSASAGTTTPAASTPTPVQSFSPLPSDAPQPPTSGTLTTTYITIGAVIAVIVVTAAALALRRRK
ncbi:MAG: PQQ-binding-like beta-propeller repeat protein [Candidatus Bathyarchaeia archaeon]|jgi:hypothetical protein